MFDSKFLDDIAKKIGEALPSSVTDLRKEFERNIKAILHSAFSKLDLVTREEFDVQVKVLARTRSKLEKLIKQVADLEQRAGKKKE